MTADIAAAFEAQAGVGPAGASADGGLHVAVGRLVGLLEEQRRADQKIYESIFSRVLRPVQATVGGAAVQLLGEGPPTGFAWAVQRITVAGLAAADIVSLYRAVASTSAQTADNLLTIVTGAAPTWHPGRTGLILQDGERITAAGSGLTASGQVTLTGEVIQLEQWLLPHFLL